MSKWTDLAIRVQSIAQAGLAYTEGGYDRERYEELRDIAAEMISCESGIPVETVKTFFCNETGYQTPKVDTRAAVVRDGKILLVHEKNGTWSLPGGWCDVDQSVASNAVKETREEAGLVVKIFVLCKALGGEFHENIETTEIQYFTREELPENLADEKTTREQILMCFDASENPDWKTMFD